MRSTFLPPLNRSRARITSYNDRDLISPQPSKDDLDFVETKKNVLEFERVWMCGCVWLCGCVCQRGKVRVLARARSKGVSSLWSSLPMNILFRCVPAPVSRAKPSIGRDIGRSVHQLVRQKRGFSINWHPKIIHTFRCVLPSLHEVASIGPSESPSVGRYRVF